MGGTTFPHELASAGWGKVALNGLAAYLRDTAQDRVVLTFDEIAELESGPLPNSAYKHAAFWANGSSYARAWRDAGFIATRRGLPNGQIAFERAGRPAAAVTIVSRTPAGGFTEQSDPSAADVVLVGCVKSKLDHAAPAQDLYVSAGFRKRRAYAESSARPWYILSALHGLVAPTTLIEPYDVYLADEPADYRRAWGEWVAAHLARVQPIAGKVVEIHASRAYVDACRQGLERRGAIVRAPLDGLAMGQQLAWYGDDSESHVEHLLRDRLRALGRDQLRSAELDKAGLYAWWVDDEGADTLSAGLGHPVSGLIYAGQTGGDSSRAGIQRSSTLRGRLLGNHFGGTVRGSTFRLTLAAALRDQLLTGHGEAFDRSAEARLSDWMAAHLAVVPVPFDDRATLLTLEERVIRTLDPPLNLQHVGSTSLRALLRVRRRQLLAK